MFVGGQFENSLLAALLVVSFDLVENWECVPTR